MSLLSATKLRRLCFYTCLSVILFTGGGLPQCMLGYHPPGTRHPPGADPPGPGTPPEQPPPADSYCCGRYASYWNAFLFKFSILNYFSHYRCLRWCSSWFSHKSQCGPESDVPFKLLVESLMTDLSSSKSYRYEWTSTCGICATHAELLFRVSWVSCTSSLNLKGTSLTGDLCDDKVTWLASQDPLVFLFTWGT